MSALARQAVIAFSIWSRTRKTARISKWMRSLQISSVGFVGCSPGTNPNDQIVERGVANVAPVAWACDLLPMDDSPWPFRIADARCLPDDDNSVDMLLANAVIEHVGGEQEQRRMVTELSRVGRSWVITTPNRWFPVESHTSVLLKHWARSWREQRTEFSRLLSRSEFRELLPRTARIAGTPWSATFTAYWVDPTRVAQGIAGPVATGALKAA